MKNKIAILLLITLSLVSCSKKKGVVKFSGDIKGLTSEVLYVYGTGESFDHIDTINTRKGNFNCKFLADSLCSAVLLINNTFEYPVFFEKGNHIKITGNANDLSKLRVKGNDANDDFEDFKKELKKSGNLGELRFDNSNSFSKGIQDKAADFIADHPSSLASLYLLDKFFVHQSVPNYPQIKSIIGTLDKKLQKTQHIAKLSDYIERWQHSRMGAVAPPFAMQDIRGVMLTRTAEPLQNKYILLTFWASWSNSHALSSSEIRQINRTFRNNSKFVVVNISLDTDKQQWKQVVRQDSLPGYQICDFNGFTSPIVNQYAVTNVPTYFFIAPDGVILARDMQGEGLRRQIAAALKQ
jgi:hypothetical protein